MIIPYPVLFWNKVRTGEVTECWPWAGCIQHTRGGYGKFTVWLSGKRSSYRAHRVAYFLHYQKDPGNLQVCHKCDNPSCVNPTHLFLGTMSDNLKDAVNKGRIKTLFKPGHTNWDHPNVVKTQYKILHDSNTRKAVLQLREQGLTYEDIGAITKTSRSFAWRVCHELSRDRKKV